MLHIKLKLAGVGHRCVCGRNESLYLRHVTHTFGWNYGQKKTLGVSDCHGFQNLCGLWVGYAGVRVRVRFC